MDKPKLFVLVGMIASGKGTYCKQAALDGAIVVNDDAIVLALHSGHYHLYNESLRPLYKMCRTMMIRSALMLRRDVIVDSTNLTMKRRQNMIQLAKDCNAEPVAVVFHTCDSSVHASRRFNSDARNVTLAKWLEIAAYHATTHEPVLRHEGFSYLNVLDERGRPSHTINCSC